MRKFNYEIIHANDDPHFMRAGRITTPHGTIVAVVFHEFKRAVFYFITHRHNYTIYRIISAKRTVMFRIFT